MGLKLFWLPLFRLIELLPEHKRGLLKDILGIGDAMHQTEDEPEDLSLMRRQQFNEFVVAR